MATRRDLLQGLLTGLAAAPLAARGDAAVGGPHDEEPAGPGGASDQAAPATGSDVGSLYPFIRSQAIQGEFPLSFLRDEFRDLDDWKRRAHGKLLELLHYAPPPCDPDPNVVERVDEGDYVRETVHFNTTPVMAGGKT